MNYLQSIRPDMDQIIESRLIDAGVPTHLHGGLLRYLRQGIIPGGFLTAVLQGDLYKAAVAADSDATRNSIGRIAQCFVFNLPYDAYGSRERVDQWADAARGYAQSQAIAGRLTH